MKLDPSTRIIVSLLCGVALIGMMANLMTVDGWSLLRVCSFTTGSLALAAGLRLLVLGTKVHYPVLTMMVIVNAIGGVMPGSEWLRMIRIPLVLSIIVLLWEPLDRFGKWRDRLLARLKDWRIQGVMGTRY